MSVPPELAKASSSRLEDAGSAPTSRSKVAPPETSLRDLHLHDRPKLADVLAGQAVAQAQSHNLDVAGPSREELETLEPVYSKESEKACDRSTPPSMVDGPPLPSLSVDPDGDGSQSNPHTPKEGVDRALIELVSAATGTQGMGMIVHRGPAANRISVAL